MRKVVVLLVVGIVLFGVSAQSANAQSANIAQKIIGTWVDHEGGTWVFNANGTVLAKGNTESKFAVTDTQLAINDRGTLMVFSISISPDGKNLILITVAGRAGNFLLTKK